MEKKRLRKKPVKYWGISNLLFPCLLLERLFRHKHLVIVEQNNFNLGSVIFEVLVIYPPSSISKVYVFLDKAI